ncbi:LegC2/C7 family Dot/Icm T4SS effector [Legionella worsleiensis]|uniref:Inclusion membrane protein A n=1 Tax=Legionella worsleiensis TaxID=45076 RepID=A0A0W1AH96_9GAMM|nr:LegC2/C7 family Dot/Icm T4SS effector [Legionella worsleiensis]KTD80715.1 inclusion membrane protein A [Legionella worsleiensis]STY32707.1 inclusion membrane protein A [Legionella worsleiensis]
MGVQETELQNQQPDTSIKSIHSELEHIEAPSLHVDDLPEMLDELTNPDKPEIELESLNKINSVKNDLAKTKELLGSIIDTMVNNPSLINQASQYWGELPIWQKVLGGVIVSGPALAAGLFAHVGALMVIGTFNGLAYTASGMILEEHRIHTEDIAEKLKKGIFGLAEVLDATIQTLEQIVNSLKIEIQKFVTENKKLAINVLDLQSEVTSLSDQVELFVATQKLLRETRDDLEKSAEKLKESVETQTELLVKNQELLDKVKQEYQKNEQQLSAKVAELQAVKTQMDEQIQQATIVSVTLQGAVQTMAGTLLNNEQEKAQFQQRLDEFINGEKEGFDKVADRICTAEAELGILTTQLSETQKQYNQLLAVQESHVSRLERIGIKPEPENATPAVKSGRALRELGIYSRKTHSEQHDATHQESLWAVVP